MKATVIAVTRKRHGYPGSFNPAVITNKEAHVTNAPVIYLNVLDSSFNCN